MTKKTLYALVAEIEQSLEKHPNGELIVAIGRCNNEIAFDRKWPAVDILSNYVEYVTPFLHQAVLTEEVFQ